MDKIVLWGIGKDFYKIYPCIFAEMQNKTVDIVALVDKQITSRIDNFEIKKPYELERDGIDYVVITSGLYYWNIYYEILDKGFSAEQIINGWIFLEKDFEYRIYKRKGWINDNIVGDYFSDATYLDLERDYKKKNITINLGRKSYMGKARIIGGGNNAPMNIKIGNYTSIAWDCRFDMGLNLDHDYTRVMNYGLTHLEGSDFVIPKSECQIEIGSDVWIGYDVAIKSGIKIGNGAVIASHSVVVGDVEPFSIVGGNPAHFIKKRFSDEVIDELQEIKWWNWTSEKLIKYKNDFDNPIEFIRRVNEEE